MIGLVSQSVLDVPLHPAHTAGERPVPAPANAHWKRLRTGRPPSLNLMM
eukprot:COSAG06_NODE_29542_length_554_cov_1.542857_2_plen_48_part_01